MLANGRRAALPVLSAARQPAFAGVVTGSFVTESTRAATGGPTLAASPSPLSRAATVLSALAVAFLGVSLLLRGIVVGRGPWGNMFEFTVAFSTSMVAGYLVLSRRYAIRSIGFIPLGVALMLLLYASSLPSEISRLVPALQNPPLLTIHVGHGRPLVRDLRDRVRGRGRLPDPGPGRPVRLAAVTQGARRGRLPRGDHRVPDLRDDDHPGLLVGLDRLVALLGLGSQGDRRARDVADLRGLPPRPQPTLLGRPAGRAPAGRGLRDGAGHVFRARSGSAACTRTAGSSPRTSARSACHRARR